MRNPTEKENCQRDSIVIFRQLQWPASRHNRSRCEQWNIVKIQIRFWTSIGVDCFASPIHNRTIELTNAGASPCPPSASLHRPKRKEGKNRLKTELAPRGTKYYVVCFATLGKTNAAAPCKMVSDERNKAKHVDPSIWYNQKKNRRHHRHCYFQWTIAGACERIWRGRQTSQVTPLLSVQTINLLYIPINLNNSIILQTKTRNDSIVLISYLVWK